VSSDYIQETFEAPRFGRLRLTFHGDSVVAVNDDMTAEERERAREAASAVGHLSPHQMIYVNGIAMHVRIDFTYYPFTEAPAEWRYQHYGQPYRQGWGLTTPGYNAIWLRRDDWKEPSSAALRKVREELAPDIIRFIESRPDLAAAGRIRTLDHEIERHNAEIDKAHKALAAAEQAREEVYKQRRAAVAAQDALPGIDQLAPVVEETLG
jgi:hypothetical protein